MGQNSVSASQALPGTGIYCCFSGVTQGLHQSLQNRERSVQERVARHNLALAKKRYEAFRMKQTIYRAGLISGAAIVVTLSARIANHIAYFASGIDYHILDRVFY
ncbi:MAG: hypothetical protein WCO00_03540 [Rhodospirillaceae bacterium]